MKKKIALIFGITGQDGSYLTKFLLKKNYIVHGVVRRSSSINTKRIDDIYEDFFKSNKKLFLHYGDITDTSGINSIIRKILPDEIYNLSAQSHVAVSFEIPEYTANVDAIGPLRILDAIKNMRDLKKIKFYQAGTSEQFGKNPLIPHSEDSSFYPASPYATAKLFGYWITKNYRESYNIFASNGLLFNHESPVRGETFVTKKIIKSFCKFYKGKKNEKLYLGNLYSKRDWGHAEDYVEAMWKMLQLKKPIDLVISTGKQYTVKDFVNFTAKKLNINIKWKGKGIKEKGYINQKVFIECKKKYFRPNEVNNLLGDFKKARKLISWKPKRDIHQLIEEMINYELKDETR